MFELGDGTFPDNTNDLLQSLTAGAKKLEIKENAFSAQGTWPALENLTAHFTGANLPHNYVPPVPRESLTRGFFSRTVELIARPLRYATIPLDLEIKAEDAVLAYGGGAPAVLTVAECNNGTLLLQADLRTLEKAVHQLVTGAAAKHGVNVSNTELEVSNHDDHTLNIRAIITAKAMFMTAKIVVSGLVQMDSALNAKLADLQCSGDGMVANLAAGFLKPQFAKVENHPFALGGFLPPGFVVEHFALGANDQIRFSAKFSAKAPASMT